MGIIGEKIGIDLSNQIKIRQEKLGAPIPSTEDIIYTNSKTSWLRVASSVDVNNPELAGIGDLGISKGDQLAKNLVLFGPAINSDGDVPNSIFPDGLGTANAAKSLLGVGGDTSKWGLTPPPGVESVNIKALNRGAIRKGQIKIKAHNPDQFRLLEVLYLRLGFTILVEWGHTIYYDNNGILQQYNDFATTPFNKFMGGSSNFNAINESLEKERKKKDYNYDGFLGYISNFNWSFNPDGSYDITLDVISRGGLIDSLTANKTGASKEVFSEVGGSGTIISEFIKLFYQRFKIATSNPNAKLPGGSPASDAVMDSEAKTQQGRTVFSYQSSGTNETEELFGFSLPTQDGDFQGEIERFQMLRNSHKVNTSMGEENDFYYMSMGLLLRLISEKCLVYEDDQKTPIVSINSEYGKHWMLSHPFQQSTDPRICRLSNSTPDVFISDTNFEGPLFPGEKIPSYGFNATKTPLAGSSLFRYSGTPNTPITNPYAGDIMGIMVNMVFVIKALRINKDEEGNVNLKEFLTYILNEINKVTGALNSFNISYSEEKNEVVIYDDSTIPQKGGSGGKRTPIHVYDLAAKNSSKLTSKGLGSFVTNLNFSSKIFPKMQNAVAIAAQNPSDESVGEKVSSFQRLNRGINDRTAKGARGYYEYDSGDVSQGSMQKYTKEIYDLTYYFLNTYDQRVFQGKDDEIENMSDVLKTVLEYDFAYRSNLGQISSPYFIPVELSLDLDGISGFKLYEKFDITPEYILPTSYPNNLNFVIQGVSHTLNNGNWTTQLQTLSWSAEEEGFIFDGQIFTGDEHEYPNKKSSDGTTTFEGFADPTLEPYLEVLSSSITTNFNVASGTRLTPDEAVQFIHPKVRAPLKLFLQNLLKDSRLKGSKILLTSSLRTFAQQAKLRRENSENAKAGRSKHNYGCAFDVNIFDQKTGRVVAGKTVVGTEENIRATWTKLGVPEIATRSGVPTWGANFKNYFDPVHFGVDVAIDASLEKAKEYAVAKGIDYKDIGVEIFDIDIVTT